MTVIPRRQTGTVPTGQSQDNTPASYAHSETATWGRGIKRAPPHTPHCRDSNSRRHNGRTDHDRRVNYLHRPNIFTFTPNRAPSSALTEAHRTTFWGSIRFVRGWTCAARWAAFGGILLAPPQRVDRSRLRRVSTASLNSNACVAFSLPPLWPCQPFKKMQLPHIALRQKCGAAFFFMNCSEPPFF